MTGAEFGEFHLDGRPSWGVRQARRKFLWGMAQPLRSRFLTTHNCPVLTWRMTSPLKSRRVLALVAGCGAPILLVACGSEPTADEPSRQAGNLGTRVCLVNSTTLDATVAFTRKDTAEEGAFPPGTQLCGEGTFGTGADVMADVTWTIEYGPDDSFVWKTTVSATNPWIGEPSVELKEPRLEGRPPNSCLSNSFKVNESITGDNNVLQMKVTRLADDQWKEFEVVFTPSANAGDSPRGITGGEPCS